MKIMGGEFIPFNKFNLVKKMIFRLIQFSFLPVLIRETIQRKRITILVYHEIDPQSFKEHINILKRHYNIISLKIFIEAMRRFKIKELPKKSLIITFDDGNKSNYQLKSVIKKNHIPITMFICSGIIGTNRHFWFTHIGNQDFNQYLMINEYNRQKSLKKNGFSKNKKYFERQALSYDEIKYLKEYVDFQSHTIYHPVLTTCSSKKAFKEIYFSRIDLEKIIGSTIYALAYPHGIYSKRELISTYNSGYLCGLTADSGFNSITTNIFKLKRISIGGNDTAIEMMIKSCGIWDLIKRIYYTIWRP